MKRRRTRSSTEVGASQHARDFFAGRYALVASETFDATSAIPEEDVAFAIGSLTFLGRVGDAQSCFDAWRERGGDDARTLAAARFFLGVAYARAGDFDRSRSRLVDGARARLRASDAWGRAFVFQGLAVHRYFTGRYRAAARHALRALRAGHVAGLAYAQMLSTDLRGHALVQLGQLHAGTALLQQAKSYAERVGFELNAHAIACSIAIYNAKFKLSAGVLSELEALLHERSHDSYSERMLRTELAIHYALRGRSTDAARELERADADALRVDARRAKVASLLARLHLTRFRAGARACADILDDVAAMTERGDVAFRAELLAMQSQIARSLGDDERTARAIDGLRQFVGRAEHHVAASALRLVAGGHRDPAGFFAEDEISPVIALAAAHDPREVSRLLALGVLGPIPEMLGLVPGRRVLFLARENSVLVEDHGDLWARPSPPRWLAPLLRTLAGGGASKEAIVGELWGIRRYHPDRHDSLVRTTIHRLRAFLEPRGEWVVVTANGYSIDADVHFVGRPPLNERLEEPHYLEAPFADEITEPTSAVATRAPVTVDDRVAARVAAGVVTGPEIARALGISESTALRALRRLVKGKRLLRRGAARATRYAIRGGKPRR